MRERETALDVAWDSSRHFDFWQGRTTDFWRFRVWMNPGLIPPISRL